MGYTTDFEGTFKLNKRLDTETHMFLNKLNETRRMKRNVTGYGIDGEFFVDGKGFAGQDQDSTIVDYNRPPKTQPSLWCQWRPTEDGMGIEWDGGEKFYNYVEWIEYIIQNVLAPKGYKLSGVVTWQGEDASDLGAIHVKNNKVETRRGHVVYKRPKSARRVTI